VATDVVAERIGTVDALLPIEPLLDVAQVAKILGCSRAQVYAGGQGGLAQASGVALQNHRFTRDEVDRLLRRACRDLAPRIAEGWEAGETAEAFVSERAQERLRQMSLTAALPTSCRCCVGITLTMIRSFFVTLAEDS
jgi:hypothetical protein